MGGKENGIHFLFADRACQSLREVQTMGFRIVHHIHHLSYFSIYTIYLTYLIQPLIEYESIQPSKICTVHAIYSILVSSCLIQISSQSYRHS